ncbi:uncharacterized protein OCT59_000165 [Rhizophagus irregularis]|uniref:F-box domain-containing protein n=2 Tax=Rhizophagus irregularis TaxID=588596 RepID=A0A2H5U4E3_RHIID|nr:hypothetical protein GLOIN_2v1774345 [Rhizophagus irregularis DAOM 181602=DAOM 197198]POG71800.1 hypothetical protein GLOIN_2v1774345 [Rhizophagus irregularis DAOM 181602=DAOM 197198]UZN98880.1 hypothetical protein OCT59_000165 [Rhizophagus irregularis]|eukprot:XP_025178666.1 hypothetical protein GLOIN_2v1774345 [Rhizophagus irregularis DAOM 181602=DAOM 197198]
MAFNRFWCRLAIPILWEDPFTISNRNYRCIEIYLHFLNEDSKAKFNEYGINNNLVPKNTLFNYPNFIKYLTITGIHFSVEKWVDTLVDNNHKNLEKLVYKSLFEVFLKHEGSLHSFRFIMSRNIHFTCFDNTMELVLQNPHFTYNIKNFTLRIFHAPNVTNIISFLKFLCSNCNLITSLHFSLSSINDFSAIRKYLSQMIISQHNLKIVSFGTSIDILYHLFLSLKNSNCSNTLNTIIFDSIDFRNVITVLQEVFDQLNVLESIHILYCDSLNSDFVQQIIKVIKPFKLRSLCIKDILYIESLQLLLQKCGDYLENFEFGSECEEYEGSRQQFLELIMKYCTKIKRFTTENPDDINIYLLIENIGQTINCLTIDIYYDDLDSNVLQNLGQVLPSKLEYLHLSLSFNSSDFEIFLKNSQNTFIRKLIINNVMQDEGESILFYIKEYIMRKERVKYLAFSECFPYDDTARELFSLEDEVNEFRLHNVIVQRYDDLCISIHGIIYDLNV